MSGSSSTTDEPVESDPLTDQTIDAAERPPAFKTASALATTLRELVNRSDCLEAKLIETLADFDEQEGWKCSGARDCVRWMCSELGMSRALAYEKLRVARALKALPVIASCFRDGSLSWSKVRSLSRVATPEDENALVTMALDCDANVVAIRCDEYRWGKLDKLATEDEAEADRQRHERRSLLTKPLPDGSIELRVVLPPDMAANLIRCLDCQEERLFECRASDSSSRGSAGDRSGDTNTARSKDTDTPSSAPSPNTERESPVRTTAAQRRADALVAMGEAALSGNPDGLSSADRFQVVAHVDAEALEDSVTGLVENYSKTDVPNDAPLPTPLRAALAGIVGGGISPSTARRLACDGSLITMIMKHGQPIAVGRKTRSWNPATRRAVIARDGCCTFPGCGATRNLDVHHVHGWALGGETSVDGGVSLCRSCHTRVHDEGWRITRIPESMRSARSTAARSVDRKADTRSRKTTRALDARRPVFRFERPDKRAYVPDRLDSDHARRQDRSSG